MKLVIELSRERHTYKHFIKDFTKSHMFYGLTFAGCSCLAPYCDIIYTDCICVGQKAQQTLNRR